VEFDNVIGRDEVAEEVRRGGWARPPQLAGRDVVLCAACFTRSEEGEARQVVHHATDARPSLEDVMAILLDIQVGRARRGRKPEPTDPSALIARLGFARDFCEPGTLRVARWRSTACVTIVGRRIILLLILLTLVAIRTIVLDRRVGGKARLLRAALPGHGDNEIEEPQTTQAPDNAERGGRLGVRASFCEPPVSTS